MICMPVLIKILLEDLLANCPCQAKARLGIEKDLAGLLHNHSKE